MTRETVLGNIVSHLGVDPQSSQRRSRVRERLGRHERNTVPGRARGHGQDLVDRFRGMLENVHGTTGDIARVTDAPAAVLAYLQGTVGKLCLSADVLALELAWAAEGFEILEWQPRRSYDICVSGCIGGVAETGTIVIGSSARSPLTQNFLGDTHIILLHRRDIVGAYEEILDKVRADGLPRHLTLVSGPSCTADIEMTLEYGVHGPRQLHVLLIDD